MINIFFGYSKKFIAPCIKTFKTAIRENTNSEVRFHSASPEYLGVSETGCTGFTNCRYMVPQQMGYQGYAIYLGCDMLVLGDIAELWEYRRPGAWVCMEDGSTEVSIIDCSAFSDLPSREKIAEQRKVVWESVIATRKACIIPPEWNIYDCYLPADWQPDGTEKLLHFTDLKNQPWFFDNHHCLGAVRLWKKYGGQVHKNYGI